MEWIFSWRWHRSLEKLKNIVFNTPGNICYGYLLGLPHQGDSNKYIQHMFLGVKKKKKHFITYPTTLFGDSL